MRTNIATTTTISVEVDTKLYQLGNKYEAVTFKIINGRGENNEGKGHRFNTEVEPGDTLKWTGKPIPKNSNSTVEIREISSKEELGFLNLFESIEYENNEAEGKINKYEAPNGSIIKIAENDNVAIELYNITIRVTVGKQIFPDFTIDPVLTIHM